MSAHCSTTIRQHYYVEGSWGWLVIAVSVVVHCLTHGLQVSGGIFILEAMKYYRIETIVETGEFFQFFWLDFFKNLFKNKINGFIALFIYICHIIPYDIIKFNLL